VLGRVVEKVSGQRLGAYLDERVFKPLKMTEAGFSVPSDKAGRIALPLPNDPVTGAPNRLIDGAEPKNDSAGAGGYSTASDYLRFAQAMLDGGALDSARVVSRTSVELIWFARSPA
jgi:CubicO group peptidase (beta-lactamase class C family)